MAKKNGKRVDKEKIEKLSVKKKIPMQFIFANKELGCKCMDGRCPYYEKKECGVGGRVVLMSKRKLLYKMGKGSN